LHLQNKTSKVLVWFVAGCAHGVDGNMKPLACEIEQQGSEGPGREDKKAKLSAAKGCCFCGSCINTLSSKTFLQVQSTGRGPRLCSEKLWVHRSWGLISKFPHVLGPFNLTSTGYLVF
jgi:hypothetical protein